MPSLPTIDGWKWQFDKPSGKWSLHQTHGSIADIIQRLTQSSAPQYDAGLLRTNNEVPRRVSTGRQSIASTHSISPPASPVSFQASPANPINKTTAPTQIQPQLVNQPQFLQFPPGQQQIPPGYAILASNAAGQPYYIHYGQLPVQTAENGVQSPPLISPPLASPPVASPLQRAATHHVNVQRRPVSAQSTQQQTTARTPTPAHQTVHTPPPEQQQPQTNQPHVVSESRIQANGPAIDAQAHNADQQAVEPSQITEQHQPSQPALSNQQGSVQEAAVGQSQVNLQQIPQQQPQDLPQQTQSGAPHRTASQRSELDSSPRPLSIQTSHQQSNAQLPSIAQEDVVMPLASELVGQTPASPIETEANPAKPKVSRVRETPPPSYDTLHLMNYNAVPQSEPAELSAMERQPFSHTHDRIPPQVYPMPPRQTASASPAPPQQTIHQMSTNLYQQQWSGPTPIPGQAAISSPPPSNHDGFPSPPTPHSVTQSVATPPPDVPLQRPASVEQPQYSVYQNPPIVSPGPVAQPQITLSTTIPPMPPQLQHLNTAPVLPTSSTVPPPPSFPPPPQSATPAASPSAPPLTHTVSAPQVLQADVNHQPSVTTQSQAARSRLSAIGKGVGSWAGKTAAVGMNWADKNPKKLLVGAAALEYVGAANGMDVMGGIKTVVNGVNAYNKVKQRTQSVPQVQAATQDQTSTAAQTTTQVQQAGQSIPGALVPGQSASPPGGVLPGERNSLFFPSPTQTQAMPAALAVRPLQPGQVASLSQSNVNVAQQPAQASAATNLPTQSTQMANAAQYQVQPLHTNADRLAGESNLAAQHAHNHSQIHLSGQHGQPHQQYHPNQAGHHGQTLQNVVQPDMANAVSQLVQSGERIYIAHHNSQQQDDSANQHHSNQQNSSQPGQQSANYSADIQQQQLQQLQIQQQIQQLQAQQLQAQQQYQQANPGQQQFYTSNGQVQYTNAQLQPVYQANQTIISTDNQDYSQAYNSVTIDPSIAVDPTSVLQMMQSTTADNNAAYVQQSIDPGTTTDVSSIVASADMTSINDAVIDSSTDFDFDASY